MPENAETFGPMAVFGGQRSAIPADLDEKGLETLRTVLAGSKNSEIRARVGDVLWVTIRDRRSAEEAIDAYLVSGRQLEDPAEWVHGMDRYQRAARLALSLGKRSPYVEKVGNLILQRLCAYKWISFPIARTRLRVVA
jgi:hypothetical protein